MTDILVLLFYASLAAAALWATCRDSDLCCVGAALVVNCGMSNFMWAMDVPATSRTGPYTLVELIVTAAAFFAFHAHRYRAWQLLVSFSIMSIMANVVFASLVAPNLRQIFLWEATTNLMFAIECLIAIGVGVSHGRGSGRFHRWPLARRAAVPVDAAVARQSKNG